MDMADTTTPNPTEEVAVSAFSIACPCKCGAVVTASDAGFTATTVSVEACPAIQARGIVSTTIRKSEAYSLAVPTTVVSHRDGQVAF